MKDYALSSKIIGEGQFGFVRLAKEKATGKKVAIKILEKKKITHKYFESRILYEKEIAKSFDHINIIHFYNIDEDPKRIYFIMEYCEKGDLFNYLAVKGKLNESESSYYFFQIINGLENIHHHGICHRDLKCENILINNLNIIKIIDFGLSTVNYYDILT